MELARRVCTMGQSIVRIERVEITDFKNVKHGVLDLTSARKGYKASILGLYGQNGSGKTALIDALSVLKYALTGRRLPETYGDFVNLDAEAAMLRFTFRIMSEQLRTAYCVNYELRLRKVREHSDQNTDLGIAENQYKAEIFDEVLSYSYQNETEKVRMQTMVDTRTHEVFLPATKLAMLIGKEKATVTDLLVAKKIASAASRSFVFSRELLAAVREHCREAVHKEVFELLAKYGNSELFIINTQKTGLLTLDALSLNFKYEEHGKLSFGSVLLNLNEATLIPQMALETVRKVIENMNVVLVQLVPGLTIGVEELGTELFQNGERGCRIQLVSKKNSKAIPLKYESEGIKKIVSVLQLLIVVYNQPSITVAIDELDSGVFEYLLGEMLRIISEKGKGQLLFTSHNLRPLETIDKGFIAFTTTNPDNRYIRFCNVKTNHNLRDFYYRDIVLGEQDEEVYSATNNYEIALAFREAGEGCGT